MAKKSPATPTPASGEGLQPQTKPSQAVMPSMGTAMVPGMSTGQVAAMSRATALVQARFMMAMHNPRNQLAIKQKLLDLCHNPSFARMSKYRLPIGEGVIGFSIRFAEAALKEWGNMTAETYTVSDDDDKVVMHTEVLDLETNASFGGEVVVPKRVERNREDPTRLLISTRKNSRGQDVYVYAATDDESRSIRQAGVSRILRTEGLRLIPADILGDAWEAVDKTMQSGKDDSRQSKVQTLVNDFNAVGVDAKQLALYLDHDPAVLNRDEYLELTQVLAAIKDKKAKWTESLHWKQEQRATAADDPDGLPGDDDEKPPATTKKGSKDGGLGLDV